MEIHFIRRPRAFIKVLTILQTASWWNGMHHIQKVSLHKWNYSNKKKEIGIPNINYQITTRRYLIMYKTIFNPNQKIRFNWYGKKLGVSGFETYTIAVFFCCSMAYPNVSCLLT